MKLGPSPGASACGCRATLSRRERERATRFSTSCAKPFTPPACSLVANRQGDVNLKALVTRSLCRRRELNGFAVPKNRRTRRNHIFERGDIRNARVVVGRRSVAVG